MEISEKGNKFCECGHNILSHGGKGCAYGKFIGDKTKPCKCKKKG